MRLLRTVLIASIFLPTISCQEYSSGLKRGTNRTGETSAVATLRTIAQAQTTYTISNSGQYGSFEQLVEGGFLDARFNRSSPEFYGYVFTMQVEQPSGSKAGFYSCNADPSQTANLEGRHFYIDHSSEIRVNATQPATAKDELFRP